MSKILRRLELVEDGWVRLGAATPGAAAPGSSTPQDAAAPIDDSAALIVPFARFREHREVYLARQGRLGILLEPADRVEELAPDLPRIALVALDFTGPGEGRGYSAAKLLRERYAFTGEVRAVGHVKQDQLYLMTRVGIDSFELSPSEKPAEALATLARFKAAYTPGAALPSITRQRFHPSSPRG